MSFGKLGLVICSKQSRMSSFLSVLKSGVVHSVQLAVKFNQASTFSILPFPFSSPIFSLTSMKTLFCV